MILGQAGLQFFAGDSHYRSYFFCVIHTWAFSRLIGWFLLKFKIRIFICVYTYAYTYKYFLPYENRSSWFSDFLFCNGVMWARKKILNVLYSRKFIFEVPFSSGLISLRKRKHRKRWACFVRTKRSRSPCWTFRDTAWSPCISSRCFLGGKWRLWTSPQIGEHSEVLSFFFFFLLYLTTE